MTISAQPSPSPAPPTAITAAPSPGERRSFGCRCVIYVHERVSEARLRGDCATSARRSIRVPGNYDDSGATPPPQAREHDGPWSRTRRYEGYRDIPIDVMHGYGVMSREIVRAMAGTRRRRTSSCRPASARLAASVCAVVLDRVGRASPAARDRRADRRPTATSESAMPAGRSRVTGSLDTVMAGLACGEVSPARLGDRRCRRRAPTSPSTTAFALDAMRALASPASARSAHRRWAKRGSAADSRRCWPLHGPRRAFAGYSELDASSRRAADRQRRRSPIRRSTARIIVVAHERRRAVPSANWSAASSRLVRVRQLLRPPSTLAERALLDWVSPTLASTSRREGEQRQGCTHEHALPSGTTENRSMAIRDPLSTRPCRRTAQCHASSPSAPRSSARSPAPKAAPAPSRE